MRAHSDCRMRMYFVYTVALAKQIQFVNATLQRRSDHRDVAQSFLKYRTRRGMQRRT